MNINIRTVPNEEIKLRKGFTGCDWWWDGDLLTVMVASELPWEEAMVLAMHETSEAIICKKTGITHEMVDAYDRDFKDNNAVDVAAGDYPDAPYKIPHHFATAIERIMCGAMNVDWKPYDDRLSAL